MLLNASLVDNYEELIERLILTVKIEKIMQKFLRKKWTLSEVLRKTNEEKKYPSTDFWHVVHVHVTCTCT